MESKQIYQYFSHQSIVYSFSRFAFFKFEDFTLIGSIVEKSRHKLTHSFIILGKFGKIVLLWIGWWSYVRWKLAIRQKSTRHTGKISVLLMYKKVSRPSSRWWVTMQTTVERTPRISLWIYQNLHIALLHFLFDLVLMHQRGGLHRSTVRNDINMASDETRSGVLNMKNLYFSYDENIDISINIFENLLININIFQNFLMNINIFEIFPIDTNIDISKRSWDIDYWYISNTPRRNRKLTVLGLPQYFCSMLSDTHLGGIFFSLPILK